MQSFIKYLAALLLIGVLLSCAGTEKYGGPEKHVTIGGGSATGLYFRTAGAICKMVNRRKQRWPFVTVAEVSQNTQIECSVDAIMIA